MHQPSVVVNDKGIQGAWVTDKDNNTIGLYFDPANKAVVLSRYPSKASFPDVCLVFPKDGNAFVQTGRSSKDCSQTDIDSEKAASALSEFLNTFVG